MSKSVWGNGWSGTLTSAMSAYNDATLAVNNITGAPTPSGGDYAYVDLYDNTVQGNELHNARYKFTGITGSGSPYTLTGLTFVSGDQIAWGANTTFEHRMPGEAVAEFSQPAADETFAGKKTFAAGSLISSRGAILTGQAAAPTTPAAGKVELAVRALLGGIVNAPPWLVGFVDEFGMELFCNPLMGYNRFMSWQSGMGSSLTLSTTGFFFSPAGATQTAVGVTNVTSRRGLYTGTKFTGTSGTGNATGMRPPSSAGVAGLYRSTRAGEGGGIYFNRFGWATGHNYAAGARFAGGLCTSGSNPDVADMTNYNKAFIGAGYEAAGSGFGAFTHNTTAGGSGSTSTAFSSTRDWTQIADTFWEQLIVVGPGDGVNAGRVFQSITEYNNTNFTAAVLFSGEHTTTLPAAAAGDILVPCCVGNSNTVAAAVQHDIARGFLWCRP